MEGGEGGGGVASRRTGGGEGKWQSVEHAGRGGGRVQGLCWPHGLMFQHAAGASGLWLALLAVAQPARPAWPSPVLFMASALPPPPPLPPRPFPHMLTHMLPLPSPFTPRLPCPLHAAPPPPQEAGFNEDRFFIHCDGALFGMMMPFLRQDAPMVTFKKPIGSVSVSGHKFVGAPVPCGVVITRWVGEAVRCAHMRVCVCSGLFSAALVVRPGPGGRD